VEKQPEAERHLLKRHYFDGITFDEAAKELSLSKSWASRLHARAIEGLTRELKRQKVKP
jgi:RNA polymerase sigma factor for flagellar operon FliA